MVVAGHAGRARLAHEAAASGLLLGDADAGLADAVAVDGLARVGQALDVDGVLAHVGSGGAATALRVGLGRDDGEGRGGDEESVEEHDE